MAANRSRGNLEKLVDAKLWHDVIANRIDPIVDAADRDFISSAATALPLNPLPGGIWLGCQPDCQWCVAKSCRALDYG